MCNSTLLNLTLNCTLVHTHTYQHKPTELTIIGFTVQPNLTIINYSMFIVQSVYNIIIRIGIYVTSHDASMLIYSLHGVYTRLRQIQHVLDFITESEFIVVLQLSLFTT